MASKLPPDIRQALTQFVDTLEQTFKSGLLSVVLYGSAARGDYVPASSDINVMVVLKEFDIPQLQRIVGPVQWARSEVRLEPFILTLEELRRSADVFPLKYMEIKRGYEVLAGEDLMSLIFVHSEHLRLACEREAKSMVLRLRQMYMLRAGLRPALREALIQHSNPFLRLAENALELTGKEVPEDREQMIELASQVVALEADVLFRLWTLRFATNPPDQSTLTQLYEGLIRNAVTLASYLDRLAKDERR